MPGIFWILAVCQAKESPKANDNIIARDILKTLENMSFNSYVQKTGSKSQFNVKQKVP